MTAIVLMALAAAVVVGSPGERELRRLRPPVEHTHSRAVSVAALSSVSLALVWVLAGARVTGWVVVLAIVASTAGWVVHGTRFERRLVRERSDTARAARTLALLLQAGQLPARALEDAAADCPVLATAALTGRLGGDVGQALAESARMPGRDALVRVSAAWRVSERTGAPIATVLSQVAVHLRKERHLAAVVAAELSAARASGRIMALLPFVALAVGTLVGANPLTFLFGSWLGEAALLAGVSLAAAGVVWTERIARAGERKKQAGA